MAKDGKGTEFKADTVVTATITVYGNWQFLGGEAKKVGATIVHELPLLEVVEEAAVNMDGTYKMPAGSSIDYKFPTVNAENASDYDYFVVLTEILSGESGENSATYLRQYGTDSPFKQTWPDAIWLDRSNEGQRMVLDVAGAGTSGGLRIRPQNNISFDSVKITSSSTKRPGIP